MVGLMNACIYGSPGDKMWAAWERAAARNQQRLRGGGGGTCGCSAGAGGPCCCLQRTDSVGHVQ